MCLLLPEVEMCIGHSFMPLMHFLTNTPALLAADACWQLTQTRYISCTQCCIMPRHPTAHVKHALGWCPSAPEAHSPHDCLQH